MQDLNIIIAKKLFYNILPNIRSNNTSVLLLGGNSRDKSNIRNKLKRELPQRTFKKYDIYYPEEAFSDLFFNEGINYLELEYLLAECVDVIIICVEGEGSIAELGAFSNQNDLRDKLLVILENKHKKSRSFIRYGPIKYLESYKPHRVIWYNHEKDNIEEIASKTRDVLKQSGLANIKRNKTFRNPIDIADLILLLLSIIDSLKNEEIFKILKVLFGESNDQGNITFMGIASLRSLYRQRLITSSNHKYVLTRNGDKRIRDRIAFDKKNKSNLLNLLDDLRIIYLNNVLR